jgi:CBS domain-containing protein
MLRKQKNVYHNWEYHDLITESTKLQRCIQKAFTSEDFQECKRLQNCIDDIRFVISTKPIPEYVPSNVAEYELYLLESNIRLDYATEQKNLELCSLLRSRVRKVEECHVKFPSLEIVDADIGATKALLEQAISGKDFRKCSHLQTAMTQLEKKREEILISLPLSMISSKDLDFKRTNLENQISILTSEMQFENCIPLQQQLSNINLEISRRNMPKEAAFQSICSLEDDLEIAKTSQNFLLMADIQIKIKDLKSLISLSRASTPVFSVSFTEVQEAIAKANSDMQLALSLKDYSSCSKLQQEIDQLYSQLAALPASQLSIELTSGDPGNILRKIEDATSLLKKCLKSTDVRQVVALEEKLKLLEVTKAKINTPIAPRKVTKSKSDLLDELAQVKTDLDNAVKNRSFKMCEQLNLRIGQLEEELEKLPSAATILKSISENERKLACALEERNFSLCDEIEQLLQQLRTKYDDLPSHEKTEDNSKHVSTHCAPVSIISVSKSHDNQSISDISTELKGKKVTGRPVVPDKNSVINLSLGEVENSDIRPVSRLRPKAPVMTVDTSTVYDVSKLMMINRVGAVLLQGEADGLITGIITDNDIIRRVIAQDLNPEIAMVSEFMTKTPMFISAESSALGALEIMIDNKFRHLPVIDSSGVVIGLLDIAKCIHDAVSVLEKCEEEYETTEKSSLELNKIMAGMLNQVDSKSKMKLLAMQNMMKSVFGSSIPLIRDVLSPIADVSPKIQVRSNIRQAAKVMSSSKKGLLVMNGDELVGICTPKDIVNRVVGNDLSVDSVLITDVMTPNPVLIVLTFSKNKNKIFTII